MKKRISISVVALLFFTFCIQPARAQKSQEALLAAWEQAQKADPSTVKFEKVKDREYHFATKRFPFDGDILVRNVDVEDFSAVNQDGISMGTVEVELQGVKEDLYRTYARSYATWATTNTLYWNPKTRQWLTSEKYFKQVRERIPTQAVWPALMGFGWLGALVIILAFLLFNLLRYNGKIKIINQRSERTLQISERNGQIAERNAQISERNAQIFEESLKLQQENVKIFQEILAELKKTSTGS